MQRGPLLKTTDQSPLLGRRRSIWNRRSVSVGGGFMLLHHLLDAVFRVTAGANQILLCIVDFVLVELQLRFGEVQLVIQYFLLVTGRFRCRIGKLRHQCLIDFQKPLRLLQARFDLLASGLSTGGFSAASRRAAAKARSTSRSARRSASSARGRSSGVVASWASCCAVFRGD